MSSKLHYGTIWRCCKVLHDVATLPARRRAGNFIRGLTCNRRGLAKGFFNEVAYSMDVFKFAKMRPNPQRTSTSLATLPMPPDFRRIIFPSQIKHTILIHLYDLGDQTTLHACTLTSRDWLNAGRRFTLRRLVLSRGGGEREKVDRVLKYGGLRDVVCSYALELVVDLTRTAVGEVESGLDEVTTIPEWVYALLEVFLPRLHFLCTLSFRGLHLDSNSNAVFHLGETGHTGHDDRNLNQNPSSNPKQSQDLNLDRIPKALSKSPDLPQSASWNSPNVHWTKTR